MEVPPSALQIPPRSPSAREIRSIILVSVGACVSLGRAGGRTGQAAKRHSVEKCVGMQRCNVLRQLKQSFCNNAR